MHKSNQIKTVFKFILILIFTFGAINAQGWGQFKEKKNTTFYEKQDAFNKYWKGKISERKIPKGKGWKQFKRYEQFMKSRINKDGSWDPSLLWKAFEEKQANFSASLQKTSATSNWTNLGPEQNIPVNGGAGRINCIAFNPNDNNIIWIGSPSGGLWKSTDGGNSWSSNTDNLPSLGISAIVIDPSNTNIMYVATGDGDAGDTYSIGILKSTDGGSTWNTTGLSYNATDFITINKLIIHPTQTSTLIAATKGGIYKTTDAGLTWTNKLTSGVKDLEIDPSNPSIWYAAGYSSGIGVYKSTDLGENWTQLSGLPTTGVYRAAITISETNPSILYALFCNDSNYGLEGVYKTTNAGSTWSKVADASPNFLGWETSGSDQGGQGWYDLCIAVSPTNENEVYVGGVNVWKTTNGGSNWNCVGYWSNSPSVPYVHADHHAFEFLPGTSTFFSGNDGGLFKTTNGGSSWSDLSDGLGIHQYYKIGVSATNANLVLGGAQDNGTDRYKDGNWTRVIGGDGMECLVDYTDENIMYGEYYNGYMMKSTNGGASFSAIQRGVREDGAWVAPFVIDPSNNQTLYRATTKIYKSTNSGGRWSAISSAFGTTYNEITALAIAPSNANYLYASKEGYRDQPGALYKTTNAQNWSTLSGAPEGITYIAVHPNDPATVWITIGGYTAGSKVYKSTDAGVSWTNISGSLPNMPIHCITVHPNTPNDVYIGTDLGIFYSSTGGDNWQDFNTGLPNVIVNELEIQVATNKLRAATYGRGLWETSLTTTTPDPTITIAYPNGGESLSENTNINITWTTTGNVGNVKIEYSLNSGSTWNLITSSTTNDGSFSWTVPASATTQGRIKITDAANTSISDVSNSDFTITTGQTTDEMINTIAMSTSKKGKNTKATAIVNVISNSSPVSSANVSATWSGSVSGNASGLTDGSGNITFVSDGTRSSNWIFTLTINSITKTGYIWNESGSQTTNTITPQIVNGNSEFVLKQNYPNPFNPSTIITYNIPEDTFVSLKIFDMNGRLVKTLVNENQSSNTYQVTWNSTNHSGNKVSSGVYIYILKTDNYEEIKRMILVK